MKKKSRQTGRKKHYENYRMPVEYTILYPAGGKPERVIHSLAGFRYTVRELDKVVGGVFNLFAVKDANGVELMVAHDASIGVAERKPMNELASSVFGRELYGDVLVSNKIA